MNILYFKYAVEIAKTKSISKAAENLYMGQPNLSRAIKQLETDLRITIFKRTPKGISITSEGEEFLKYAGSIISQVEAIEEIYKKEKKPKQTFSVCVPRAGYISYTLAEFAKTLRTDISTEIFYKETNSLETIENVVNGDCNLGIIRYQTTFDNYFQSLFNDKKLVAGTITEFTPVLMMSKEHPLARKEEILISDLADYIEITYPDTYIPTLPISEIMNEELSGFTDKHIQVFERGSQFELLGQVTNTFMWGSQITREMADRYTIVQKRCTENRKMYRDVLIYQKGYTFSELDNQFITLICEAERKYMYY